MFAELKVLDLTSDVGILCGQLLADMGANVQQWVRPARERLSASDPLWQSCTLGKGVHRIDWPRHLERLAEALQRADVLIEDESEAFWSALGWPEEVMAERFPHLIRASISHFGRAGPKAHYAATDLIAMAASGHLYVSGQAGAAPLRLSVPQAHAHASADAAVGICIALYERARSGRGQLLDISAQHSSTLPLLSRALDAVVGQPRAERAAYEAQIGPVVLKTQFPAKDGEVVVLQGILPPLKSFMDRLMAWVHEAGLVDAALLDQDWGQAGLRLATGELSMDDWAPVEEGIGNLMAGLPKADLMDEAVARRLLLAPVFSLAEVLDSDHFSARGFVKETPAGRRLGPFAHLPASPLPLRRNETERWREPSRFQGMTLGDDGSESGDGSRLPLAGLKVLDVFWVVAGPGATRMLADYGATVVHVESSQRLDMVRNMPPYVDGVAEPERAALHHSINANKLNVCLDLGSEEGRAVLADLIRWADVFTESFAPGVIDRMGFGYEAVRAINPEIVMISSSLMGRSGPWRNYAGYGNSAAAVTGFHALTGRPGERPTGCFGPYTDFLALRFNALAILAAVDHRARSGEGQYIDMSQAEAALYFLSGACHEYLNEGAVVEANGNRDRYLAPHGVYPASGEDRWIALAVRSDEEWRTLCALMGREEMQRWDLPARRAREDEIDALLCDWTAAHEAACLETRLQEAGIPAHRVLDTHDLAEDAQLQARGHFIEVGHRDYPRSAVESTRLLFSRTVARHPGEAPWFGRDNDRVLEDLLGYDPEVIHRLEASGALR